MSHSPGKKFRLLVEQHKPLPVAGAINAYCAMLAEKSGLQALYLSGAGVANASYGLPDLGMTSLANVLEDVSRITEASSLPLLVDIDTGWGHVFNIARSIKLLEKAGVAAVHIEDQALAKRCGHRPNKTIVSLEEMGDRIKACVDARKDPNFVIMARTDAYAAEGMQAVIERAQYCVELGADMVFPEAMQTREEYAEFTRHMRVPVLANITEFGKTPLFTREALAEVGISLILYPLSAFRAMSFAAMRVYHAIQSQGSQQSQIEQMQTRNELYDILNYQAYESKLDELKENEDVR